MIKKERLSLAVAAMFSLLAGLWPGLNRIGWDIAVLPTTPHHGAIMVGGFLGTLISLEKVIPLKHKALYLIPFLNAFSVVFFFLSLPKLAVYTMVASSAALVLVFYYYLNVQRSMIYVLMLIGTLCWLVGNILLLTKMFYPMAFPWWAAFILFIITAERLELMKFLPVSRLSKNVFLFLLIVFTVGILFSFHGSGNLISGLALMGISLWLLRNDVIAVNLRKTNMSKFVAVALVCGYISLFLTGIFFFSLSEQWLTYDAIVHSFFLGFAFSMIFAHGPMILPGVLGVVATPFSRILYLWLAMLQASWLIRVFADVTIHLELRKVSGLLSAMAILGYFVTMAVIMIRNQKHGQVF